MLRDWLHHMSHINHSAACRKVPRSVSKRFMMRPGSCDDFVEVRRCNTIRRSRQRTGVATASWTCVAAMFRMQTA